MKTLILLIVLVMFGNESNEPIMSQPEETNYRVTMSDNMRFTISPKLTPARADSIINTFR